MLDGYYVIYSISNVSETAANTADTVPTSFARLLRVLSTLRMFDTSLVTIPVTWEKMVMMAMDEAVIDSGPMALSDSRW